MVSAAFWEACKKAAVGRQVRERTPLGNHVIEVLDKREAGTQKDLSEVRGEIRQLLLRERRESLRESLLAALRGQTQWRVVSPVSEPETTPDSGNSTGASSVP
jgi:hypothetical protein